jgi:hypothetical protein
MMAFGFVETSARVIAASVDIFYSSGVLVFWGNRNLLKNIENLFLAWVLHY